MDPLGVCISPAASGVASGRVMCIRNAEYDIIYTTPVNFEKRTFKHGPLLLGYRTWQVRAGPDVLRSRAQLVLTKCQNYTAWKHCQSAFCFHARRGKDANSTRPDHGMDADAASIAQAEERFCPNKWHR